MSGEFYINGDPVDEITKEEIIQSLGLDGVAADKAAAAESATLAQAWAEGTLPGGAGTKSAKEWSDDAAASVADAAEEADRAEAEADEAAQAAANALITLVGYIAPDFVRTIVAQFGVTYTFAEPTLAGQYANGDWWALGPVSITSISPASFLHDGTSAQGAYTGRAVHGTMVNPGNRSFASGGQTVNNAGNQPQGFDSLRGVSSSPVYNADFNDDPGATGEPLNVTTGSVVKFVSRLTGLPANNRPAGLDMVVLTVVDQIPLAGSIRPGVSGTDKTSLINQADFNLGVFQNLAPPASAPTFSQALDWIDRYHETSAPDSINNTHAKGINNHREYGQHIAQDVFRAALCLHLSNFTEAQKRQILTGLATIANDLVSRFDEGGWTIANGGGNMWKLPIIAIAMAALPVGKRPPAWAEALSFANRLRWAENGQLVRVDPVMVDQPRFIGSGGGFNEPVDRASYQPHMVGAVDWGFDRSQPHFYGSNWGLNYRSIWSYALLPGLHALEMMTGGKAILDAPQLWLYMDNVYTRRALINAYPPFAEANGLATFALDMLDSHRVAKVTAPVIAEANVRGATLWLRCDISLDDSVAAPATSAFSVLVNGVASAVDAVSLFRQNIGLTLASPVAGTDVVTVNYTAPGSNPVKNVDGVNLASFSGQAVTNRTEKVGGSNSAFPVVRFAAGVRRATFTPGGTLGASNTSTGTLFLRLRIPTLPSSGTNLFYNTTVGNATLRIGVSSSGRLNLLVRNATGGIIADVLTPVFSIAANTFYDALFSWDLTQTTNTQGLNCFLNGSASTLTFNTWNGGAGVVAGWARDPDIGATSPFARNTGFAYQWGAAGTLDFDLAAFWLNTATRVDITSSSERAKFAPGVIGSRGDGVTGSIPTQFHVGTAAQWNDEFGMNRGTGSRFYPMQRTLFPNYTESAGLGDVTDVSGSEWV
jgi:uncharacterized repeat protein (TIGR02059 family)